MKVEQMKRAIIDAYPYPEWKEKVLHNMSDEQVIAIYYSMLRSGRFEKIKQQRKPVNEKVELKLINGEYKAVRTVTKYTGVQLSLFDRL
jgi:hypothetical protein